MQGVRLTLAAFVCGVSNALGLGELRLDSGIDQAVSGHNSVTGRGGPVARRTFVSRWRFRKLFQSAALTRPFFLTRPALCAGGEKQPAVFRVESKPIPVREPPETFHRRAAPSQWPDVREYTLLLESALVRFRRWCFCFANAPPTLRQRLRPASPHRQLLQREPRQSAQSLRRSPSFPQLEAAGAAQYTTVRVITLWDMRGAHRPVTAVDMLQHWRIRAPTPGL